MAFSLGASQALATVCADLEASRIGPNQGRAIIYGLAVLSQVHQRSQGLPEDLFQEKGKDAPVEFDRLTDEQFETLKALFGIAQGKSVKEIPLPIPGDALVIKDFDIDRLTPEQFQAFSDAVEAGTIPGAGQQETGDTLNTPGPRGPHHRSIT